MDAVLNETRDLLIFLLILGGAVGIHEAGHLVASVLGRVRIVEAGFGLPPRLAKLGTIRGTVVSLNWIPLGGFVRPAGEFGGTDPGDFAGKPRRIQAMVLIAGPLVNVLTAFVILWAAFLLGGPDTDRTRVLEVNPGSPAAAAGLLPDDIVRWPTYRALDGTPGLSEMLRARAGTPVQFEAERDGVVFTVELTPRLHPPEDEGPSGFTSMALVRPHAPLEAAGRAGETMVVILRSTVDALRGEEKARLVGPLGLKQATDLSVEGSIRWSSFYPLLYFAAMIHLGLAFTNLLPIPALDGGRLAMLGLDALGIRLTLRVQRWLAGGTAIGLIGLMALLTVLDLVNPLVK